MSPATSGMAMPAIVMPEGPDSPAAICGEWQSDRNSANPQERSQAAANEDTHNSSAAKDPANMRLIFTARARVSMRFDAPRRISMRRHLFPHRTPIGGSFWQRRQNHEIIRIVF